ncbi:hypothetical protein NL676_038441 [Syzygium grande]|nr:hypothetical protein NL676_038441 [Syzygium grande]
MRLCLPERLSGVPVAAIAASPVNGGARDFSDPRRWARPSFVEDVLICPKRPPFKKKRSSDVAPISLSVSPPPPVRCA